MKKVILSVLTVTMILSNVAIVSAKPKHDNSVKNSKVSNISQYNKYRLYSEDPR